MIKCEKIIITDKPAELNLNEWARTELLIQTFDNGIKPRVIKNRTGFTHPEKLDENSKEHIRGVIAVLQEVVDSD